MREAMLNRLHKKEQNQLVVWRYNPTKPKDEAPDYKFANTSGNEIMKTNNLKVIPQLLKE